MPLIRRVVTGSTENALEGLKFSVTNAPALISLFAAGETAGDNITFSIGDQEILVNTPVNVRTGAGIIDTDRDALLVQERVPAGKLFLDVDVTTSLEYMLLIEPIG